MAGRDLVGQQQRVGVRRFFVDGNAHVIESRDDAVHRFAFGDFVGQVIVNFGVGQVAAVAADLDQGLDLQQAQFLFFQAQCRGRNRRARCAVLAFGGARDRGGKGGDDGRRNGHGDGGGGDGDGDSRGRLRYCLGRTGARGRGRCFPGRCHRRSQLGCFLGQRQRMDRFSTHDDRRSHGRLQHDRTPHDFLHDHGCHGGVDWHLGQRLGDLRPDERAARYFLDHDRWRTGRLRDGFVGIDEFSDSIADRGDHRVRHRHGHGINYWINHRINHRINYRRDHGIHHRNRHRRNNRLDHGLHDRLRIDFGMDIIGRHDPRRIVPRQARTPHHDHRSGRYLAVRRRARRNHDDRFDRSGGGNARLQR
ncbi:hypothetical protein IMCC9480_1797 [Oxalobacteraceae bacterium IMCC9480]|nr:hypothetical protein IMCC9480_1797 [Oxalobacteraceae bacterium IMCC9480]